MTDYESDSIDGEQPDMIAVSRAEWELKAADIADWMKIAEDYATLITKQAERIDELRAEIERQAALLAQAREAMEAALNVLKWNDVDMGIGETGIGNVIQAALAALDAEEPAACPACGWTGAHRTDCPTLGETAGTGQP